MSPESLLISCEHAGNEVPPEWDHLFRGRRRLLRGHRGWDSGALELAESIARIVGVHRIHACTATRLLADVNRSPHNPDVWSEITRGLPPSDKERLLAAIWRSYRIPLQAHLEELIEQHNAAFHLSVHAFTPVLDGVRRNVDIGLLYDPSDASAVAFCRQWRDQLQTIAPHLRVRFNSPYRGIRDGAVPALRRVFGFQRYLGIELEVSQGLRKTTGGQWRELRAEIAKSFADVYKRFAKTRKSRNRSVSPRAKVR